MKLTKIMIAWFEIESSKITELVAETKKEIAWLTRLANDASFLDYSIMTEEEREIQTCFGVRRWVAPSEALKKIPMLQRIIMRYENAIKLIDSILHTQEISVDQIRQIYDLRIEKLVELGKQIETHFKLSLDDGGDRDEIPSELMNKLGSMTMLNNNNNENIPTDVLKASKAYLLRKAVETLPQFSTQSPPPSHHHRKTI